jgi:hypothetical protein
MQYNSALTSLISDYAQVFRDEFEAIGSTGVSKYEERKAEAKKLLN